MSARKLMTVYGTWMAVLTALYYVVPSMRVIFWAAIGVTTVAAVVTGAIRYGPRRRTPWMLIAGAVLAFTAGDFNNIFLADVLGQEDPFPSLADAFYLVFFFPLLLAGMVRLLQSGATTRDRASLLDALTVTAGVGLLSWIFFVAPLIESPDLTVVEKAIAVSYPLQDLLVLTVLIRMTTAFRRSLAVTLLVAGVASLLIGDVVYGLIQLAGIYAPGGWIDLPWAAFYGAIGAAALHPSMVDLTEPKVLRRTEVSRRRVALLGLSSLIPPAVLLIEALTGTVRDGVTIAVMCAALFALVVARLSGVLTVHRLALARESGLRQAGASLLTATDDAEVTAAIRAAVADLLPSGTPHRVAVALQHRGGVVVEVDAAAPGADRAMRMVYTRTLPQDEAAATGLGDFEVTLRCPLDGRRVAGAVYVAADEIALVALQEAAQILASQAALALEGIAANAENARRDSEAYFRTLVLNAADVILILDDDDAIRYASPSSAALFGPPDLTGVVLTDLVEAQERASVRGALDGLRAGVNQDDLTDWTVLRGGERAQAEVSLRDLRHERTVGGVVVTLRDVTERRRLERELIHRAYYDALTGLPNRSLFQDWVERAVAQVVGTETTAGVLLVGLDDFKVVNDTMGHDTGDELLVAVGQRLVATVQPPHDVARLGSDEFAIVVEAAAGPGDVDQVAEQVIAAFAQPFLLINGVLTCHASVGVATTADATDGHEMLSQADIALAMAKSTGKASWRRYEASLHTKILERLQLRAGLDQAIADREFLLNYQPVVDLGTGHTRGFEALVRWQHPTRGLVPPLEFIQIAEECGLIVPLGAWILKTAIATGAQWQRLRPTDGPHVSVNVSARQFRTPGFIDLVHRELAASGLPPHHLILEITESLLLGDDKQVWADLTAVREAGVRVAIDDFGTGYSSLSYLHQVPIDIVKLDKSFVDTISTSAQQLDLVNGIVHLAHTLGLQVVAEGIETSTDSALLLESGCEFGQGYLFARPMSQDDAADWLLTDAGQAVDTPAHAAV